jgi:hypothetical protein
MGKLEMIETQHSHNRVGDGRSAGRQGDKSEEVYYQQSEIHQGRMKIA